jgi:hypothetical protein
MKSAALRVFMLVRIAHEVVDEADLALERHSLEGVRRHPAVVRVDIGLIDQLAVAGKEGVFLVPQCSVGDAGDDEALLSGREELGANPVGRRVQRCRAEDGAG